MHAASVVAVTSLVFAGAVGATAPRSLSSTPAVNGAAINPVAAVAAAGTSLSGPAVVAVGRSRISLHVAMAANPAPPVPPASNDHVAVGIPATALAAYRNAQQMMAVSDPACGISWNLLAGIGRIESMHAANSAIDGHGTAIRPIYGPVLDGTVPGNEVVVQSSIGGQVSYARAMGPMQFLPATWARYASDGDGDGVADPQNLYDSTLAAARYLCSGGLDMRDPAQVMSAILRYNNSMPYARNVLGWAAAYASGVMPVELPEVTGPAPPLGDMHLENPKGIGPGLPLNVHALPPTDPLAQTPLIDFGPPVAPQQPILPSPPPAAGPPDCTVICIDQPESRAGISSPPLSS